MSANVNWRKTKKVTRRAVQLPGVADRVFAELGIDRVTLAAFEDTLQGHCVMPGMPTYASDSQGKGLAPYSSSPLLIIFCATANDVWLAMKMIHDRDWEFTCRSGGHSTAGYSVNNNVVLDLSGLNAVTVDSERMLARVGVGSTFDHLNSVFNAYGVHVPTGGCGDVGVGGFFQGGGFGFTSRMYGMMCDCAESATVMLWDGRMVEASATKNSDLFWAIRGGTGGNFGVLIEVVFRLVRLPEMWGFVLQWSAADAPAALLEMQKSYTKDSPYGSIGYMGAFTTDANSLPVILMAGICTEGRETGMQAIAPLMATGKPTLLLDQVASYPALDPVLLNSLPGVPLPLEKTFESKDCGYIARMCTLEEWSGVFKYFADNVPATNRYNIAFIEPYGGAINKVAANDSAFIHRDTYMDIYLDSFWQEGTDFTDFDAANKWKAGFMQALSPLMNGHKYQNYPQRDNPDFRYTYWGDSYPSLLFVKSKYDPNNVFRFEQSITPFPNDPGVRRSDAPSMFSDRTIVYEPWSRSFINDTR